jgi:transposase
VSCHPARGRYFDKERSLQATVQESVALRRARDRIHRRGCSRDSRRTSEKKQKAYYSGKKKRHTLKSQVVINGRTRQVICTAHAGGPIHDFALYQRSHLAPHESLEVLADSGYQGLQKLHGKAQMPQKKPRKSELSEEQKQSNRELARRRVVVEYVIRSLKIFRILAERYRNRRKRFSLRVNLIAGLYNFEPGLG